MKRIVSFAAVLVCAVVAAAGMGVYGGARAAEENAFFCIRAFYQVNSDRNWWDRGKDSIAAAGSTVEYIGDYRYMLVDYNGRGDRNTMWGLDDYQIPRPDRDWSGAKYLVLEIENLSDAEALLGLVLSAGTNDNNLYIADNTRYYLKTVETVEPRTAASKFLAVPAGFDGFVAVPVGAYAGAELTRVLRISFEFKAGSPCKVQLGRTGYAASERFLTGDAVTVRDDTVYGVPDVPAFRKAPARPTNEPETSKDNNYA